MSLEAPRLPLHLAAKRDSSRLLQQLLQKGHDINARDSDGNTALHVAAAFGATAAVRVLLQHFADPAPDTRSRQYANGISNHESARAEGKVARLLRQGAGALGQGAGALGQGAGALGEGAGAHEEGPGADEVGPPAEGIEARNDAGWTAAMQAARHGRVETLQLLLDAGADVRTFNSMGMNALALAAASGSLACVRALLLAGATSEGQMSAVLLASYCDHPEVLRVLLDRGASAKTAAKDTVPVNCQLNDPVTALAAVCAGDYEALERILDDDPQQAKTVTSGGVTALMAAAVLGDESAARLLLERGADACAVEAINGWSPLMLALYNGHVHLAQVLLNRGADMAHVTPTGHTVLDFAALIQCQDIMKAYIKAQHLDDDAAEDEEGLHQLSGNLGFKKLMNRVSDKRSGQSRSVCSDGVSLLSAGQTSALTSVLTSLLCGCWLQKTRPRKELCNLTESCGSSIINEALPPAPPPIVGEPILPYLPHHPPKMNLTCNCYEEDDSLMSTMSMKPPIDGTLDSNKWKSSLLPQHKHRDVGVIKPPPRVPNVKVLLKRIERQRASESESSAGTASTGTTVQTKRLNNRLQPSNMVQPQSMAELLTMSLGSRKVSEILHKLSLDDYAAFFEEQDVDFEAFLELTPDDIRELGINDQRSRIKIMRAIQSLRRKVNHR
ncbi:ankyrin repeat and SAM domain-containing protein 6 [Hyalella azteca]|uniref:Ankyrin repeat and SAM domain-containing protein 6 n=1 Tax=Hyalella azteca TaxID=294128 RepID=A0A8B7P8Z3_HYAAZ|nr:ankyrin repeat and SAM domain-containing protein 6 [Hyalella azteca]